MVSKKTSDKDVTKVSKATTNDTAKKVSRTGKKTATAATAPKVAVQKNVSATANDEVVAVKTVKKVSPAPKKAAVKTNNVPTKEDKVVAASAPKAKTQSNAKKTTKTVKAKATVVNSGVSAAPNSGEKAAMLRSKRGALKENVQKAEAKKFMDLKDNAVIEQESCRGQCCFISGVKTFFRAWIDGYKKMFDYKSRTNRYDFWAFMLLNFVLFSFITIPYQFMDVSALTNGQTLPPVIDYTCFGLSLIVVLAHLSLFVRRLHDAGYNGWKGFFGPMTYSILGIVALIIVGELVLPENAVSDLRTNLFELGLMVLLFINTFYLFKTFIAAGFMEEDAENAYGLPKLLSECGKKKVLRYAALYCVISVLYMVITLSVLYYFTLLSLINSGVY